MKYGLKNIILHHSYFRNKRCIIACGGHTNNTGANGAGKTSALQLIPIFYGYSPEKIVNKDAGKLSFLDYYLPHTHSFIAFEYERVDGYACAVLYRHAKNAELVYRFVKGRADDILFADFTNEHYQKSLPTAELFKLLEQQHIKISRSIKVIADYKAILSYQRDRLHKDKKLMYDAQEFSLNASNKSMQHIGELTVVLLNSNQLMLRLREMLSSIILGQEHLGQKPNLNQATPLLDTIQSLHTIHHQTHKLQDAVNQSQSLLKLHGTIKNYQRQTLDYDRQLQSQLNDELLQKQQQNNRWQQQKERYHHALDNINAKMSEVKAEKEQKEKQLSQLQEKYEHYYSTNDILNKVQAIENLSIYQNTVNESVVYYEKLNSGFQALKDNHHQELLRLETQFNEQVFYLDKQIDDVKNSLSALHLEQQQKLASLYDNERQALNTLIAEQQSQQQDLFSKKLQAELAIKNASNPTADEQAEIDNHQQQMKQLQQQIIYQNQHIQNSETNYQQAKKQHQNYQNDHETLAKQLSTDKDKQSEYLTLLDENGTLLDFLDNGQQNWRENIGRVINPELLKRKDLSPHWESVWDSEWSNFYGLVLDSQHLPLPLIAQEKSEIQRYLDELEQRISGKEKQLSEIEKSVQKAYQLSKDCQTEYQLAKQKQTQLYQDLDNIQKVLESIQIKHAQNAHFRQEQAKQSYDELSREYDELLAYQNSQLSQKQAFFDNKRQIIKDEFDKKQLNFDSQIFQLVNKKEQLKVDKQTELEKQAMLYQKALVNEGVDENEIEKARKALTIAEQRLKQVQSYQNLVNEYHIWLETQYCQKDKWQNELYDFEEYYERLSNDKKRLEKSHKDNEFTHHQAIATIDRNLQEIEQQQDKLAKVARRCDELFETVGDEWVGQAETVSKLGFELFVKKVGDSLDEQAKAVAMLRTAYQTASHALQTGDIAQAWHERVNRHRYLVGSVGHLLASMRELDEMMTHDIPQKTQASIGEFCAIANEIVAYYEKISRFNNQVKQLSNQLSAQINQEHQFRALSDIRIVLTSALAKDEVYRSLKSFSTQYQEMGEMTSLPSDSLLDDFNKVTQLLNNYHIDTNKPATLIELEIFCMEQGREFRLTHHSDLSKASSTGISTMLIVVLFASLTRYLCADNNVAIHWPLDEIGRIDSKNTEDLFDFMNKQNIYLFCAEPELSPIKAKLFEFKNDMDRKTGIRRYQKPTKSNNPLLAIGGEE